MPMKVTFILPDDKFQLCKFNNAPSNIKSKFLHVKFDNYVNVYHKEYKNRFMNTPIYKFLKVASVEELKKIQLIDVVTVNSSDGKVILSSFEL